MSAQMDIENHIIGAHKLDKIDGFAEILPEDKHMIVLMLQNAGYIVGMTGDGANVGFLLFTLISYTSLIGRI